MVRFIRTLALFALCTVLVVPLAATAAPLAAGQPSPIHLTIRGGQFLRWFNGALTALWLKAGCHIDPNGLCVAAPPPANGTSDAGCRLDPDGQCLNTSTTTPPTTDAGCRADPNGACNR